MSEINVDEDGEIFATFCQLGVVAWLLLGWANNCDHARYATNHLGQLSLPSLRGR